ncbi:MAG: sulfotransferase family protein [Bacteroidota bacterium]
MSLKIIGAGLGRTGTTSLKFALEHLGYTRCYHMIELADDHSRLKYWKKLYKTGQTAYDKLFAGYQAAVDVPACLFYKQLFEAYPKAKVILTVRDSEDWYASTMKTLFRLRRTDMKWQRLAWVLRHVFYPRLALMGLSFQFNNKVLWKGKFQGRFEDKAFAIQKYHEHNAAVKHLIPKEQLLVFNIRDGWAPLCSFLNLPIPEIPFPKMNHRDSFHDNMKLVIRAQSMMEGAIASRYE